jgi:hypothetical protein
MGNQGTSRYRPFARVAAILPHRQTWDGERGVMSAEPPDLEAMASSGPNRAEVPLEPRLICGSPGPEIRPYTTLYHPLSWRGWWDFWHWPARRLGLPYPGHAVHGPWSWRGSDLGTGHHLGPTSRTAIRKVGDTSLNFLAIRLATAVKLFWYDGASGPTRKCSKARRPGRAAACSSTRRRALLAKRLWV